ncbi:MAG: hypothetical protein E6G04_08460 [Actinobacteria bacterium]|nr:MAG: hypothetical protein E6G04_08460 [Actinomycetota bacterium]
MKILTDLGCVHVSMDPLGEWEVRCGERQAESHNLAHALWSIGIPGPSARVLATDIIHGWEGWMSAN